MLRAFGDLSMESTPDHLPFPLPRNVDASLRSGCLRYQDQANGWDRIGGGFGFNLLTNPPFFGIAE
jgi:hypothetical protein